MSLMLRLGPRIAQRCLVNSQGTLPHRMGVALGVPSQKRWASGEGEGKGGGGGGSIRSGGGAFGKREAAQEEQYFRREQEKQIKEMKTKMTDDIKTQLSFHEKQLVAHKRDMEKHRAALAVDGNKDLHELHIAQHEEAIRKEEEAIRKLQDMWKNLHL